MIYTSSLPPSNLGLPIALLNTLEGVACVRGSMGEKSASDGAKGLIQPRELNMLWYISWDTPPSSTRHFGACVWVYAPKKIREGPFRPKADNIVLTGRGVTL